MFDEFRVIRRILAEEALKLIEDFCSSGASREEKKRANRGIRVRLKMLAASTEKFGKMPLPYERRAKEDYFGRTASEV